MMSLNDLTVLASWGGLFWNLGAIVLFLLGLLLIVVILIQDSKDGGLGGALGGGGLGGEALFGARGQKDIVRFTAFLGGLFALILLILGVTGGSTGAGRTYPGDPTAGPPAITAPAEEPASPERTSRDLLLPPAGPGGDAE
jgi:protein translocase SecG subunit